MPDDYKYLGMAYMGIENPGSDSLKAVNDSIGVTYLAKAAPFDTTENLYSDIAKYYYRAKKHPEAVATLDSAAKHGFKADVQDLFRYGMSNYTLGFQRDSLGKSSTRYSPFRPGRFRAGAGSERLTGLCSDGALPG